MKVGLVYKELIESPERETLIRGGTRGAKSFSLAQISALWLLHGTIGNLTLKRGVCSVVRKTLPSLRFSFMRDFEEVLEQMNFKPSRTYDTYNYNGRTVEFFSVDESSKMKGRKRDILIVDELTELEPMDYTELCVRTKYKIFASYNPEFGSWVVEHERTTETLICSYLDNPFLSVQEIEAIESLKTNSYLWQTLGLGNYATPEGLIFTDVKTFDLLPSFVESHIKPKGGLDFGFSADPCAMALLWIDGKNVYIKELLYATHVSTKAIANILEEFQDVVFVADSAEPRTISELRKMGAGNLTNAIKGKGSIKQGIRVMLEYTIHLDAQSPNLIKEFMGYTYQKGTSVPIDKNNHLIDAIRMCLYQGRGSYGLNTEPLITNGGNYSFHSQFNEA